MSLEAVPERGIFGWPSSLVVNIVFPGTKGPVSDLEDDANDVDKNSTADDRDGVDATNMAVVKL